MRGVFDFGRQGKFLLSRRQKVEHLVTRDEGGCAQRNLQGLRGVVIVTESLRAAAWDAHGKEGGHHGRIEVVKCGVDVPAVEAGEIEVIFCWDGRPVEGLVVRMLECDVSETFILGHEAVADDLNLWLVRDSLEIGVEDGLLCIQGLAVAVRLGFRVEAASQFCLSAGGDHALALDANDMVVVERFADGGEVAIGQVFTIDIGEDGTEIDG